jgi:hypothetical protein
MPDIRSSGSTEGAHAELELHRNITGRIFAGTPIAGQLAGTSLITNELAASRSVAVIPRRRIFSPKTPVCYMRSQ